MNYQLKLEEIIKENKDKTPTLLLHSCCAPCSSYVLEYLSNYFDITILFYNPNITSKEEYDKNECAGKIVEIKKDAIGIKSSDGIVYITKIKPFGKKEMLVRDYLNGIDKDSLLGKEV